MKLRPYQQQGFEDIISSFDESDSPVMFVLATGGGKTVTFVHIIKHYLEQGSRVMLIAHREELITQSHITLQRNKIQAGIIKAEYPQRFEFPTQVCSIQTLNRRAQMPHTDLIIIDEAHHVSKNNTYGKLLEQHPNAKVLMVTATPYRLDGKGFLNVQGDKQTNLIVNRTTKQLIEDGWLVPFKYYIASLPDLDKVKVVRGDYDEEEAYEAMKLVPVVQSYIKHVNGLKGICYAVNVKHSKDICRQFQDSGIGAEHLDANTPKEERQRILQSFRAGDVKVVVNVGILTEGADFPDCQFILMARPTKSLSMFLQMVGRVTRTSINTNIYPDAESRRAAIYASDKPYGIVLDCAKCWKENGFPDDDIDWVPHFLGKKEKKVKDLGMIDIYVIEDPETGEVKRTKNIKETEGSILIEVTQELRKTLSQKNYISEFNRLYYLAKRLKHVNKKGFFVWYKFKELLVSGEVAANQEVLDYVYKRLISDPIAESEIKQTPPSENPMKIPTFFFEKECKSLGF